jgi:hypothetical protein
LVPAGAPLQLNCGETLRPVQPKPFNNCSSAIVAPSLISVLVKVMSCGLAALAQDTPIASAAIQTASRAMAVPPALDLVLFLLNDNHT